MSSVNFRTQVFGVLFVLVSALTAALGLRLLVSAYSTFDLELSFSREDALQSAHRSHRYPIYSQPAFASLCRIRRGRLTALSRIGEHSRCRCSVLAGSTIF